MKGILSKSLKLQVPTISPSIRRHVPPAFSSLVESQVKAPSLESSATTLGSTNYSWTEPHQKFPSKAASTVSKSSISQALAETHRKVSSKTSSAATKSYTKHAVAEPHLKVSSYNVPKATYPTRSTAPIPSDPVEVKTIATQAVNDINAILQSNDYEQLRSLFLTESCYWKDHLGLTSTRFVTLDGADQIIPFVSQNLNLEGKCLKNFGLENGKAPQVANLDPEGNIKCIQAFITFDTQHAKGRGLMTLLPDAKDGDKWKVYMLFTNLSELTEHPWKESQAKERYALPEGVADGVNWKDWREKKSDFTEGDPAVLVVGKLISPIFEMHECIYADIED